MIDILLISGSFCLPIYIIDMGFKSKGVSFSLLCTISLLSCILYLDEYTVDIGSVEEVYTEISSVSEGNLTTKVLRTDCKVGYYKHIKYHNYFGVIDMLKFGVYPSDIYLIEGRTCKYVQENLL